MKNKEMLDFLVNLLNTPSPSGYTNQAIAYMEDAFSKLQLETKRTNKNALLATIPGKDDNHAILFSAHVDTLGMMVRHIKENGRIAFALIGGFAPVSVDGENVTIHTMDGKQFTGTAMYEETSVHIYDNVRAAERTISNMEIRLDEVVTTRSDVEALGIQVGDVISLDPRVRVCDSGYIKSRHLDDKACVASLYMTAKYLSEHKIIPNRTIHFFISNYEEVGHGSSASIPPNVKEFIAVDMAAPGKGQSSDEHKVTICAMDSTGPYDTDLRHRLMHIAKEKNIDATFDIYPHYGSDGSAALRAGWDIRVALIGPGVDGSHAYERTHIDGINHTTELMIQYILQA